jgi:hypothetical protein
MLILNRVLLLILSAAGTCMAAAAQSPTDTQAVASELTRLQTLSVVGAQVEAGRIRTAISTGSGGGAVDQIRLAVALERAGDAGGASALYKEIEKGAAGQPAGASAHFRGAILAKEQRPAPEQEAALKALLSEPDTAGWFLTGSKWEWGNSRVAARRGLVQMRSTRLSFVLFEFLRTNSPFGGPLAFLGVLVALSMGAKILELPLIVRSVRDQGRMAALAPQVRSIQQIYSHDALEMNKQLMQLYGTHGVNFKSGCMTALVDLIFVVWALISLADFAPQMALDGSSLFWIADVTGPDLKILFVWSVVGVISTVGFAQPGQKLQIVGGGLLSGAVFGLIAYFWKWPSYVMIFWTMLNVAGAVINLVLWPVRKAAENAA